MSLTLDPTLSDAQDGLVRRPIVELISTQPTAAIPFDGEYFNSSNDPEIGPGMIVHSSGRIVSPYIKNDTDLVFLCTDVNRTRWTETVIDLSPLNITNISLCEMTDGKIGITLVRKDGGTTYYLQYMIVQIVNDTVGTIASATTIETYVNPDIIKDSFVIMLEDESFLLVYSYYDDTDYFIYKRTSSNFTSWSVEAAITLAGFESTYDVANPSLIQVASDDIILFVDHVTNKEEDAIVTNISMLISDDNGITWGAPEQITSYTVWGSGGMRPYPALTDDNRIKLAFYETNSVLFLNYDSDIWQNDCPAPQYSSGASLHFDPATRLLYVKQINWGVGTKNLCGVVVINVDNWEVERNYNKITVPDYSDLFYEAHVLYGAEKHHSEGKYVAISTMDHINMATMVINDETETITTYVFKTNGAYGDISVNMDNWPSDIVDATYPDEGDSDMWKEYSKIVGTWVDEAEDRVYLLMTFEYAYQPYILVGYIDLTEVPDPHSGLYTFHEVSWITSWSEAQLHGLSSSNGGIMLMPEEGKFCLYGITPVEHWDMNFGVYSLSSGDMIKEYNQSTEPSFPFNGIGHCTYRGGHVYGMIEYTTREGQGIHKGLCDIDISNEIIQYHRPSYATIDQYDLLDGVIMGDDKMAFAAYGYGVAVYDFTDGSWLLYDNDNLPGFEPLNFYGVVSVEYNAIDGFIYVGSQCPSVTTAWAGIRAVSEGGSFDQGKYMVGELVVDWEWSTIADLSIGMMDYDFAIAIDEEGILWSSWIRKDLTYTSIKWDKDQADLNLEKYLLSSISLKRDIANVSNLSFSLSYGHLFDINNSMSALNIFSKKGRMITVRFGENIDGAEYWQNQGTYYIKNTKVSYQRGSYPTMSVTCEDRLSLLEKVRVIVSEYYNEQYPEALIRDVVKQFTDLEDADILISDFSTRHEIWHQVIDDDLIPAITEILDHFQQFLYMNVDNVLTTREVRVAVDSVDHEYVSNAGTIMNFSPDDNYSNFTNRVIVTGEARDLIEVLYAEELITNLAGSGGWWESGDTQETVYFSEDHEKKVRNVRLNIIKSIEDFKILWQESGGTEYISYEDPEELYIIVTIEFPGLQSVLVAFLVAIVAIGIAAIYCDYAEDTGGAGCGWYIMIFSILCSAAGYVLGQVATYDYEIWGRAVGEEKQNIQAIANDVEFQNYLNGLIVTATIDDPFCYTVESCGTVAEYELEVVKAQRKRISFSKVAHLQDEVGDIIKIYHPYSNKELNIFITTLTRRFISGKSGSFIDQIEGWSL